MADRHDNTVTGAFRAHREFAHCGDGGSTYGGPLALARHRESGGAGATGCPRLRGSRLLARVAAPRKGAETMRTAAGIGVRQLLLIFGAIETSVESCRRCCARIRSA
jgi:hypothetical protein